MGTGQNTDGKRVIFNIIHLTGFRFGQHLLRDGVHRELRVRSSSGALGQLSWVDAKASLTDDRDGETE